MTGQACRRDHDVCLQRSGVCVFSGPRWSSLPPEGRQARAGTPSCSGTLFAAAVAHFFCATGVARPAQRNFCLTHTALLVACGQGNVDVRVARIFNTFGPRMNPSDGRVVSNFIVQVTLSLRLRRRLPSCPWVLGVTCYMLGVACYVLHAGCCFRARPLAFLSSTPAQAVATHAHACMLPCWRTRTLPSHVNPILAARVPITCGRVACLHALLACVRCLPARGQNEEVSSERELDCS